MEQSRRKLPLGLQSFTEIRRLGCVYVDKTDAVWNLVNNGNKYCYLSRPRRFGKSVLVDTLQAYFEGRKILFEGLKIMQLEKQWTVRPVIRLDMSCAGATEADIKSYLDDAFKTYESAYGMSVDAGASFAVRLKNIIMAACRQTGQQVAVLIDEYDSPLQHSWRTPHHQACCDVYQNVFAVLKTCDAYEQFVFITGITKFTQISLFSVLNNLCNISFNAPYAAICGITKQELKENFEPEIALMAKENGCSADECIDRLQSQYDGYHFCVDNMEGVFNPFSLINALHDSKLRNYWASSGATSLLPKFVDDMEIRLKNFDHCAILGTTIETSDVTDGGPELFLYQSGYLTIKGYTKGLYLLGIPNHEVRQALYDTVLPALAMRKRGDIQSAQAFLYLHMTNGNTTEAKMLLKALIADVPYSNKKLASIDMEERYRLIMSTIFNAIGFRVEVEHMLATGRIDMVVETPEIVYILELKLSGNGGMAAAEKQMREKHYLEPFENINRKVIGLAVELDDQGKGLIDWKEIED